MAGIARKPLVAVGPTELAAKMRGLLDAGARGSDLAEALLPVANDMDVDGAVASLGVDCVDARTALVIKTSGSTGNPKLVAISAAALKAAVDGSAEAIGSGRWVLALPVNYIAGVLVLLRSYSAGYRPLEYAGAHFDAGEFVDLVATAPSDAPLYTALVPVQVQRLVEYAGQHPSARDVLATFAAILVGGQRLDRNLRVTAAQLGMNIVTTYGASETAGGCCYNGVLFAGGKATVIDGRLALATESLALGYVRAARNASGEDNVGSIDDSAFVEHAGRRWFVTSDRGKVTGGVVTVTGRVDSIINRGGLKLDLAEVERWAAAELDPAAVVVEVPDATWGQGFAVVIPGPQTELVASADAQQISSQLSGKFGKHARPAAVLQGQIPRLLSGKPDRKKLAASAHEYDVTHD